MNTELEAEFNSRAIMPWHRVRQQLGLHERQLQRMCAELRIPVIVFSRQNRGLLLDDVDRLIAAHAKPCEA